MRSADRVVVPSDQHCPGEWGPRHPAGLGETAAAAWCDPTGSCSTYQSAHSAPISFCDRLKMSDAVGPSGLGGRLRVEAPASVAGGAGPACRSDDEDAVAGRIRRCRWRIVRRRWTASRYGSAVTPDLLERLAGWLTSVPLHAISLRGVLAFDFLGRLQRLTESGALQRTLVSDDESFPGLQNISRHKRGGYRIEGNRTPTLQQHGWRRRGSSPWMPGIHILGDQFVVDPHTAQTLAWNPSLGLPAIASNDLRTDGKAWSR